MTEVRPEPDNSTNQSRSVLKALSLRKNVLWSVTGNLALAGTQWLVLIVLAQLGAPSDIGMWTLATALVTPIFMLCDMAMMDAHTVDDLSEFKRSDYFALRLVGATTASVLCVTIGYFWFIDQPGVYAATLAFVAVKFVHSQMMLNAGVFQREQRVDLMAGSSVSRGVSGLAAFAVGFWMTNELWVALLCQAFAWAAVLTIIDRRFLSWLGVSQRFFTVLDIDAKRLFRLFVWLLPLALSAAIAGSTPSAPRLVLDMYVDLDMVGIFGAVAFFYTGFSVPINAIGIASASRLRSVARSGSRKHFLGLSLKLVALTTAISIVLCAIGWLFGQELLAFLYGREYVNHGLLMIVLFATAVRAALAPLQVALTAGHVLWRRFFVNATGFGTTLVAALILIPTSGVDGAAIALLVGSATRAVLLVVFFALLTVNLERAVLDKAEAESR